MDQQISEGMIKFEGGDGSSVEKAVIIKGAVDDHEAVQAESYYITGIYGTKDVDWKFVSVSTIGKRRSVFDEVEIMTMKNGSKLNIYFDVSAYTGSKGSFFH